MKHLAAIIVALTLANAAQAQPLSRVRNLLPGGGGSDESARPVGSQANQGGMSGPFLPFRAERMMRIKTGKNSPVTINQTIILNPYVINQQMRYKRRRGPFLALFSRR